MKAIHWDDSDQGVSFELRDIPADMQDVCAEWREKMVERPPRPTKNLLERSIWKTGDLSEEEIRARALRERTLRPPKSCRPLCGSAFKNKGVQAMLDAVIEFMPSPVEVPAIKGILDDDTQGRAPNR